MSDTPRTDAIPHNVADLAMHARKLEREIDALRKDKARLDWLQSSGLTLHSWEEGDVWARAGIYTIRVYIDKQMEEAQ